MFPDIFLYIFLLRSPGIIIHMIQQVGATDPVFSWSFQTILNKRELIICNSMMQSGQYCLYTMPTMSSIYDKPGAEWNGINTDNNFQKYFKTSDTAGDVVQK
jgi:hypothetical protein